MDRLGRRADLAHMNLRKFLTRVAAIGALAVASAAVLPEIAEHVADVDQHLDQATRTRHAR